MKRTILIACGALILTAGGLQLAFGHQDAAVQDAAPANTDEARELAGEIAKAYKNAKTLRDTVQFEISGPGMTDTQTFNIALGSNNDAHIDLGGMELTAVDGKLYLSTDDVPDKYFATELQGNVTQTIQSVFGEMFPVPPQLTMREGETVEQQIRGLTMGMVANPEVTGSRQVTTDDGKTMQELTVKGMNGSAVTLVNPETKLIQKVNLNLQPPGAPEEFKISATMTMAPQIADSLPEPIAFAANGRKEVNSLEQMEPTPIAVGEMAPDFTLPTLDGEQVTLSDLKGQVVVLDFWATWCGPCKIALPKLQEFANWVKENNQPVKVYAVDVWERGESAEAIEEKVREFWTENKYTMPTLLDFEGKAIQKYGFSSIPTTVVVGPDGKIVKIHVGFSPNMVDMLKSDVAEATKATG